MGVRRTSLRSLSFVRGWTPGVGVPGSGRSGRSDGRRPYEERGRVGPQKGLRETPRFSGVEGRLLSGRLGDPLLGSSL